MRNVLLTLMLLVGPCDCCLLFADSPALTVKSKTYNQLTGVEGMTQVGDVILLDDATKLGSRPVGVIRIDTEADNVELVISDANRTPLQPTRLTENIYLIEKPGKWWCDITVIDFKKNIYGRTTVVVEVGQGPNPPPPNPDPPGPTPPPPSPVPNEYGVGKVAYEAAPKDGVSAMTYSKLYAQAGDFLFGIPSLKFVTSSNDPQNRDPNRSIFAWINQQTAMIQCPDVETCKKWAAWRQSVADALIASQQKRQFTRQDWYNAFNEISRAVGMVK